MKRKREKGYWLKKSETFESSTEARSRAGHLRSQENTFHVTVSQTDDGYVVNYSVAKWYLAELDKAGIKL